MRAGASEDDAPRPARWLCGTFTIGDPQASHLLASLPAAIILRGDRGPALEGLEVARRMLLFEMQSPSQGRASGDDLRPTEDGMDKAVTDRVEEQVRQAFPEGTIARAHVLQYGDDPEVEPGHAAMRVFFDWPGAGRAQGQAPAAAFPYAR